MSLITGKCECSSEWKTAGITDTLDYIKGACAQFQCQSDTQCQARLPHVPYATCPVRGWNCDCGFRADYQDEHVGCMNSLYVLNIRILRVYRFLCLDIFWYYGMILACIALPFGQRRVRCDCRRSWWLQIQRCVGYVPQLCDGECHRIRTLRLCDELALSIWVLQVTAWCYVFASVVVLTVAFLWTVVVWILVALVFVAVAIMGCLAACSEGGGGGGDGCCVDGCTGCGDGCACCGHGSDMSWSGSQYGTTTSNTNVLIVGPYGYNRYGYYDPCCDCGGTSASRHRGNSSSNSSGTTCCCCFYPLVWLVHTFPRAPDNIQGGLIGLCAGTHILRSTYTGSSRWGECLSLAWCRGVRDVRSTNLADEWRSTVQKAINERDGQQGTLDDVPQRPTMDRDQVYIDLSMHAKLTGSSKKPVIDSRMGIPIVTHSGGEVPDVYNPEHFTECWICREQPRDGVVVWQPCKHVVCKTCSDKLFDKRALCVFCQQAPLYAEVYEFGGE